MAISSDIHDGLEGHEHLYLDKLRLSVTVLLEASEEPGSMSDALVSELFAYKDRLDRALLLTPDVRPG